MKRLDDIYAIAAFGTTIIGVVGLTAGVNAEVVGSIVLVGALIVGVLDVYWLLVRE